MDPSKLMDTPYQPTSTHLRLNARCARDLSNQVRKTAVKSFAYGGMAEIWKGELTADSGHIMEVQTLQTTFSPFVRF